MQPNTGFRRVWQIIGNIPVNNLFSCHLTDEFLSPSRRPESIAPGLPRLCPSGPNTTVTLPEVSDRVQKGVDEGQKDREVRLDGHVGSGREKRAAEDCVEDVTVVEHTGTASTAASTKSRHWRKSQR